MNTEKGARLFLTTAGMSSIFAFVVAIILGARGEQGVAALFLLFALADCVIAWVAYRRYTAFRQERWKRELRGKEDELRRVFDEEAQKAEDEKQ